MTTPTISRAHLFHDVRDSDGNVVPNVKVTVYERGSAQLLQQTIYSTPSGSGVLTNPFTTSSGIIDFYLAQPQDVAIGVSVAAQGGVEQRIEDIGVLPPSDQLVRSPAGFQILNAPVAGYYMQASDDRTALWVSAAQVMASRPTPTVQLRSYDFSTRFLDDLVVSGGFSYVDVSGEAKPQGFGFLQALSFTGSVSIPAQNFPERGRVIFAYKVVSASQGQGAARLKVSIDDRTLYVQTPTSAGYVGVWSVGYLEVMTPGTHQVVFDQVPGADPDSVVLLGPITVAYGNNIPPHDHGGSAAGTTRLGPGSVASGTRATALGDSAQAEFADATAVGANAVAGTRGSALGSQAWAANDAVAIGYRASGSSAATQWVALGSQAIAGGDSAVAIGYDALAGDAHAVAVGAGTTAAGVESVALGTDASADGYRAVALGSGAQADHDYSMAIGPGVIAQAPHEARLGDDQTVVVMPGSLRHTGASAVIGGPTTGLGFYGQAPIPQPVVRGSRNGNAVLTALLASLAAMGLIEDESSP